MKPRLRCLFIYVFGVSKGNRYRHRFLIVFMRNSDMLFHNVFNTTRIVTWGFKGKSFDILVFDIGILFCFVFCTFRGKFFRTLETNPPS